MHLINYRKTKIHRNHRHHHAGGQCMTVGMVLQRFTTMENFLQNVWIVWKRWQTQRNHDWRITGNAYTFFQIFDVFFHILFYVYRLYLFSKKCGTDDIAENESADNAGNVFDAQDIAADVDGMDLDSESVSSELQAILALDDDSRPNSRASTSSSRPNSSQNRSHESQAVNSCVLFVLLP